MLMVLDQEVQELGQPPGLIFGEGGGLREQLSQAVGIALFEELDNGRGRRNGSMAIVGGLDPVALALEGVGREDEAAAGEITVKGGPVDGRAGGIEGGQAVKHLQPVGAAFTQGGEADEVLLGGGLLSQGKEGWVGADFEEELEALIEEGLDAGMKTDGMAQVPGPVLRGLEIRGGRFAGEIGDEVELWGREGEAVSQAVKGSQDGIHERGVEGMGDVEQLGWDALGLELSTDVMDGLALTGDDGVDW